MAKNKRINKGPKNTYEDYQRKFYTAREQLKSKGHQMYDNYVLSKAEWEAMVKAHENTMKREIARGERKEMGDINKLIVKQQTYQYSARQAEIYQQQLILSGEAYRTKEEIRLGMFAAEGLQGFYDMLDTEYKNLVNEEIARTGNKKGAGKSAKLLISQRYFGSN